MFILGLPLLEPLTFQVQSGIIRSVSEVEISEQPCPLDDRIRRNRIELLRGYPFHEALKNSLVRSDAAATSQRVRIF